MPRGVSRRRSRRKDRSSGRAHRLTIDEMVRSLGVGRWYRRTKDGVKANWTVFAWPPDAFAIAATVLRDSGAYLQAARPTDLHAEYRLPEWAGLVDEEAKAWRRVGSGRSGAAKPSRVLRWLDEMAQQAHQGRELHELTIPDPSNQLWRPWLKVMCVADHACRGMGTIFPSAQFEARVAAIAGAQDREWPALLDRLEEDLDRYPLDSAICSEAMLLIHRQIQESPGRVGAFHPITLCKKVDPTRAIVVPKMRTSQRGVTIRSFSLHLALLNGSDVEPAWNLASAFLAANAERGRIVHRAAKHASPESARTEVGPYNLVIFPWPGTIVPTQFRPLSCPLEALAGRPPETHRFFEFGHSPLPRGFSGAVQSMLHTASSIVGPVHGLVLPEMALTKTQFDQAFPRAKHSKLGVDFVACGVYETGVASASGLGRNYAVVRRAANTGAKRARLEIVDHEQEKHHRWALDGGQVATYGLGGTLNPSDTWWEGIGLGRRHLNFFALDAFSVFTVLICEDLARPDPVADAVRAIGPNLVICLLLDGPQLRTRWSSRYATALADDPGSSVLTLSSLGMVNLSRTADAQHDRSRVIALWRQPGSGAVELSLPRGADALVLSLSVRFEKEYSLDGRHDSCMASVLSLTGVHPLRFPLNDRVGERG